MAPRMSLEKIVQLYKTSPIFQDLVETSAATALIAGGQAAVTDMTPEEIALSGAAGFGAAMVGRPIMGRAGQAIGGAIDRSSPTLSRDILEGLDNAKRILPKGMSEVLAAKLGPYSHLGGAAQYGNLIGRAYGDNAAQLAVGVAAPFLLGGKENV